MSVHNLLPGTPGTLTIRDGTGTAYWYRVFYSVPGKQAETLICRAEDHQQKTHMEEQIAFSQWVQTQVGLMKKLGFQVADKLTARVMVELYNSGAVEAGLTLVGTLAFMAMLNDLGIYTISARTLDIDLARNQPLKLAAPMAFLQTMQATGLPFVAVPGMPNNAPSTSVKLPGIESLRVDVLTPGKTTGTIVTLPELGWAAQAIEGYDYLLDITETSILLAGGHAIPVRLPQPSRLVWHKLFSSVHRGSLHAKAAKDRQQANLLGHALAKESPWQLDEAWQEAPAYIKSAIQKLVPHMIQDIKPDSEWHTQLQQCLG
ncbi:GSU2403 family nucleotidyltransferase fold protein [Leeia oryzae]|uniref:GSU2403 family nucleotidyltransferase fold protein n=1 Tax=Leeia oryzae TaxID=356662 RepID=UPI0014613266|nr:GSU2403 family nucleotidyltransferase fold protein [Leeia oryzae]